MAVTELRAGRAAASRMIRYAADPSKTTGPSSDGMRPERYVTYLNCTRENAARQFSETKRLWSGIAGQDKAEGNVCLYGYQSFLPGEVTPETAHEIGVRTVRQLWPDREAVVATHLNTGCVHNHFVLNSVSLETGKKGRGLLREVWALRKATDGLCREYGLYVQERMDSRKKNYAEILAERQGVPTNRGMVREDVDRAVRGALTEREFFQNLREMGYEVRLTGKDGKPLKRPLLRPAGAERFYAFDLLDDGGWSLEELRARVAENRRREDPFPEAERQEAARYRRENAPVLRATGLYGLYLRYCFELGILKRFPTQTRGVSFRMREDLRRLELLDEETRLLGERGIETAEDLARLRSETEARLRELKKAGEEIKTAAGQEDPEEERQKLRRILRLCADIEKRSSGMEEALPAPEDAREEGKEGEDGLGRGGRGGTDREDRTGGR